MSLDRCYVLRTLDHRYVTADGSLTTLRELAARLRKADADRLLDIYRYKYDALWGMSIEECPKRGRNERRRFPPVSPDVADAMVAGLKARQQLAEAAKAARLAAEAEVQARFYAERAAKLRGAAPPVSGRAIDLDDLER